MQRSFKIILYYVHLLGASEQHVAVISKKVLIMYNKSVSVSSNLFSLSYLFTGIHRVNINSKKGENASQTS